MSSAASAASFANERKKSQGDFYGSFLSNKQYINQYTFTTAATAIRCYLSRQQVVLQSRIHPG